MLILRMFDPPHQHPYDKIPNIPLLPIETFNSREINKYKVCNLQTTQYIRMQSSYYWPDISKSDKNS